MGNVNVERPRLVGRERTNGRQARIIIGAVATAIVVVVVNLVSPGATPVGPPENMSLTAAQQAEADRLTGLAEFAASAQIAKARAAETARWQARGDWYRMNRTRQSEIDRLNGLAGHLALTGLSQRQRAEADRLTRLAEHLGVAP